MMATIAHIDDIQRCARLFRLGRDIEAALLMVDVVDATVSLFSARSQIDQAQLATVMGAILDCQERQDWLGVADALQYELAPLMENPPADRVSP